MRRRLTVGDSPEVPQQWDGETLPDEDLPTPAVPPTEGGLAAPA
jgi:hypothetical protein